MSKEQNIAKAIVARALFRQGLSQASIADRLGIFTPVVHSYIKRQTLYNINLEDYEAVYGQKILTNFLRREKKNGSSN